MDLIENELPSDTVRAGLSQTSTGSFPDTLRLPPIASIGIPLHLHHNEQYGAGSTAPQKRKIRSLTPDDAVAENAGSTAVDGMAYRPSSFYAPFRPQKPETYSEAPMAFVNVHTPASKKHDAATASQIKSHVMRRVHQERRKSKAPKLNVSHRDETRHLGLQSSSSVQLFHSSSRSGEFTEVTHTETSVIPLNEAAVTSLLSSAAEAVEKRTTARRTVTFPEMGTAVRPPEWSRRTWPPNSDTSQNVDQNDGPIHNLHMAQKMYHSATNRPPELFQPHSNANTNICVDPNHPRGPVKNANILTHGTHFPSSVLGPEIPDSLWDIRSCPTCNAKAPREGNDNDDDDDVEEIIRSEDDEVSESRNIKVVVKSISKHLGCVSSSRSITGSPTSLLDSADMDPFSTAAVPITRGMSAVYYHCEFTFYWICSVHQVLRQPCDWILARYTDNSMQHNNRDISG